MNQSDAEIKKGINNAIKIGNNVLLNYMEEFKDYFTP